MDKASVNVLIIEDSHEDVRLFKQMLGHREFEHPKFNFTTTDSIQEGIQLLKQYTYFNAIILDLNLADSYGLDSLDTLKQKVEELPPIVVVTGLNDLETSVLAIRKGASAFIYKRNLTPYLLKSTMIRAISYSAKEGYVK